MIVDTQPYDIESECIESLERPALLAWQDRPLVAEARDKCHAADTAMAIMAACYPIEHLCPGVIRRTMSN